MGGKDFLMNSDAYEDLFIRSNRPVHDRSV